MTPRRRDVAAFPARMQAMKGDRVKHVPDPDPPSGPAVVAPAQQEVEAALTALIESVLPRVRPAPKGKAPKGAVSKSTAPKSTAPKSTAPKGTARKRPAR